MLGNWNVEEARKVMLLKHDFSYACPTYVYYLGKEQVGSVGSYAHSSGMFTRPLLNNDQS